MISLCLQHTFTYTHTGTEKKFFFHCICLLFNLHFPREDNETYKYRGPHVHLGFWSYDGFTELELPSPVCDCSLICLMKAFGSGTMVSSSPSLFGLKWINAHVSMTDVNLS